MVTQQLFQKVLSGITFVKLIKISVMTNNFHEKKLILFSLFKLTGEVEFDLLDLIKSGKMMTKNAERQKQEKIPTELEPIPKKPKLCKDQITMKTSLQQYT